MGKPTIPVNTGALGCGDSEHERVVSSVQGMAGTLSRKVQPIVTDGLDSNKVLEVHLPLNFPSSGLQVQRSDAEGLHLQIKIVNNTQDCDTGEDAEVEGDDAVKLPDSQTRKNK